MEQKMTMLKHQREMGFAAITLKIVAIAYLAFAAYSGTENGSVFDILKMHAIFQIRVRKLTGKPAFLTIADCESEARRIHLIYDDVLPVPDTESNAFRNQFGLLRPDSRIAWLTCLASGGVTRTENTSPLAFRVV